jgi:hypothetical protein
MKSVLGTMSVQVSLLTNYSPGTEASIEASVKESIQSASVVFRRSLEEELLKRNVFHLVKIVTQ